MKTVGKEVEKLQRCDKIEEVYEAQGQGEVRQEEQATNVLYLKTKIKLKSQLSPYFFEVHQFLR